MGQRKKIFIIFFNLVQNKTNKVFYIIVFQLWLITITIGKYNNW